MAWTIVTGGAGFIGLNLVERLLSDGSSVLVLDSKPLPDRAKAMFGTLPGTLRVRTCDITDFGSLKNAVDVPVDRIVHAAAITSGPSREATDAARIVEVNVGGAVNIAQLAAHHSVPRVAFISTGGVFGGAPAKLPPVLVESTLPTPDTLYGATKYSAELVMRRLAGLHGFSLVICRLGWVFGPWEHDSGVRDTMSPVFQLAAAMLGGQSVRLPRRDVRVWTYSRDVAANVVRLLRSDRLRHTLYHVVAPTRLDLSEWGARLHVLEPGARCAIGDPSASVAVDLFGTGHEPLLASERLGDELDPGWIDEDLAFDEYCGWLQAAAWPIGVTARQRQS